MESCQSGAGQDACCTVFLSRKPQYSSTKDRRGFGDTQASQADAGTTTGPLPASLVALKGVKCLSLGTYKQTLAPGRGVKPGGTQHCDFLVLISETLAK